MSDDEARLVYTDDPELRSIVGAWLDRAEMRDAQQRAKLDATIDAGTEAPITGQTAAGDARKLRGIPAIGRGVGGAMSDTDPLRTLLRRERRRERYTELLAEAAREQLKDEAERADTDPV